MHVRKTCQDSDIPIKIMKLNIDLSDCNWTRIHNHLVRKRTLNHLAKLANG